MTDRELMQMALDVMEAAIKAGDWKVDGACDPDLVLTVLRARLTQPEPEPVAWMYEYGTDNGDAVNEVRWYKNVSLTPPVLTYNRNVVPLYAAPPQREWVGLTVEEIEAAGKESRKSNLLLPYSFARAIEAKLKEKNGF